MSEQGLKRLICTELAGHPRDRPAAGGLAEPSAGSDGTEWLCSSYHDYDREGRGGAAAGQALDAVLETHPSNPSQSPPHGALGTVSGAAIRMR